METTERPKDISRPHRISLLLCAGAVIAASPIVAFVEMRREAVCHALARGETVLDQPDFTVDTSLREIQEICRVRGSKVTPECFARAMRNTPPNGVIIPPHLRLFGDTPHGPCIPTHIREIGARIFNTSHPLP